MRLTVLGKSPAWQDADGACSGYLVEESGTTLLMDCGNGVFAKLRKYADYAGVDAIVISHLHADHFIDLVPFAYALLYSPREHGIRPVLHVPEGATAAFDRITGAWDAPGLIGEAFEIREYAPSDVVEAGPLRLRFRPVPHWIRSSAIEVSSANAPGRIVYGSDHRPSDELVDFARGADLLLLEATLPRPESGGERGHITPGEAGEHAAAADARHLVLVHISDELDPDWARSVAQEAFGRPVTVAAEGQVYEV